jgi:D-glycero-D-manno-heptose 1,7-bisphosphate phosphatase
VTSQDFPLTVDGVWLTAGARPAGGMRPGLFLDRDGVIVEEIGYLHRADEVRMMPGAASLIARANQAAIPVCVVTNQSGIARGMYGWAEFAAVEAEIERRLAKSAAALDGVAACPFHPDFTPGYAEPHDRWRKPGPGMIEALAERLAIDRARSWFIGDKAVDIEAARAAGLAGIVLVRGAQSPAHAEGDSRFEIYFVEDMAAAGEALGSFFRYQS